jgi:hypothetical protein
MNDIELSLNNQIPRNVSVSDTQGSPSMKEFNANVDNLDENLSVNDSVDNRNNKMPPG